MWGKCPKVRFKKVSQNKLKIWTCRSLGLSGEFYYYAHAYPNLHHRIELPFASSKMGRLLNLGNPVGSYDHFCVANWSLFFTRLWIVFSYNFFRTPHATNLSYISINDQFLTPLQSAFFRLDPIACEYIHSWNKKGENFRERHFNW